MVACICEPWRVGWGRDRKVLGAYWPVSLLPTKMVRLVLVRDPVYKKKVKSDKGRHHVSILGFHMHTYGHMSHTYTCHIHIFYAYKKDH